MIRLHQRTISYIIGGKHGFFQAHSAARSVVASERRSLPKQNVDLLQTLLETPTPAPSLAMRISPKQLPNRALTTSADEDAFALLQALIATPIAPKDERRRPVTLRSVETPRYPKPSGYTSPTWFDTLLHRSSQVLLGSSLLVLGYWVVNVPMNNWLHPRPAPVVRALSTRPSATTLRITPTKMPILVSRAAPDVGRPEPPNDRTVPRLRTSASAIPITVSAEAHAIGPRATQLITAGEQIQAALAVAATPTDIPQPTASPLIPSPTTAFMWPTMTPVQLSTVSKPSPAPVQRAEVSAQPGAPARPNGASVLPTRLIIPALGLDVPIKEVFIVDDQWQVAEYAAGYLNGSGLPGVPGNLAMSGHAGLYGAVFANLGALNPGDDIFVDAAAIRYHYHLRTASAVWPNQTKVLDSTETPTMTLITCTNWDTQRLVAQADYVDSSPVPAG